VDEPVFTLLNSLASTQLSGIDNREQVDLDGGDSRACKGFIPTEEVAVVLRLCCGKRRTFRG